MWMEEWWGAIEDSNDWISPVLVNGRGGCTIPTHRETAIEETLEKEKNAYYRTKAK